MKLFFLSFILSIISIFTFAQVGSPAASPAAVPSVLAPAVSSPVVPPVRHIPDSIHLKFRIGTNFDFLNDNLQLNKIYGALSYTNDRIAAINKKNNISNRFYFGMDLGGSRSNTLTILKNGFISHAGFIDPVHPQTVPDSLNIISQTIKSKQSQGFGQISLSFNPYVSYNFKKDNDTMMAFRVGLGLYAEMYRVSSYLKYSDTSVIEQHTGRISDKTRFVPTNFNDSIGSTSTYGYFGISLSLMLYTDAAIVKLKGVFGKCIAGQDEISLYQPTRNTFPAKNRNFYFIDATIIEPHSKISVEANIRGFLPSYTPVWGIYATKTFDLARLYETIAH